jgi:hypothetical protein
MAETKQPKFAFQCKNCGAVEPAEAAGDNAVPGACHACRHGVKFEVNEDGTGFTVLRDPDNWIVLADLDEKELAKDFKRHGLKSEDIERHEFTPAENPGNGGASVKVHAKETIGSKDKAK